MPTTLRGWSRLPQVDLTSTGKPSALVVVLDRQRKAVGVVVASVNEPFESVVASVSLTSDWRL
jgi:chemotaxis signal transduction protein